MSDGGDWSRRAVLDKVMLDRAGQVSASEALDVGCGEGRFCRLLSSIGIKSVGIDPTRALIKAARHLDPEALYHVGTAENLPFRNGAFHLVVSYLSLVDVEDAQPAIAEMTRVLAPGGTLLIANLASHNSAGRWLTDKEGRASGLPHRPLSRRASGSPAMGGDRHCKLAPSALHIHARLSRQSASANLLRRTGAGSGPRRHRRKVRAGALVRGDGVAEGRAGTT